MTTYKAISIKNTAHAAYITDAVNALLNDMDWITRDDEIIIFKGTEGTKIDWVAIPAVYCDETTEFTTLKGKTVRLDSSKWGDYVVTETEWK